MSEQSKLRTRGAPALVAAVIVAAAVAIIGPQAASRPSGAAASSANPDERAAAASASKLVKQQSADIEPSERDKYYQLDVISTPDGLQYVPYARTYFDLPVIGGDFVVVTDAKGKVRSTSVQQQQPINVALRPQLTKAQAERIARRQLAKVTSVENNRLVVHAIGRQRLAFQVVVAGTRANKAPSRLNVFVDAFTGKVLRTQDEVVSGSGTGHYNGPNPLTIDTTGSGGQYSMRDPNRRNLSCADYSTGQVYTGSDDNWGNGSATDKETGCVDLLYTAAQEWSMLSEWLGRNGIDGNGGSFPAKVGLPQNNAYWTGSGVEIGYNRSQEWLSGMDVVAHEFGHALDQSTPGGMSGSQLQEHLADVFGTATEFYDNQPSPHDAPDYTIGEEINFLGTGVPIRVMYDPPKGPRAEPGCYSSSTPTAETHDAAGPANHWFYLVAEGTSPGNGKPDSPTCNSAGTLTGIGIQAATKIVYNAMLRKTSGASYLKYRTWTLAAAKDLDPSCTQFNKVKAAWDAVSVPAQSADPTCTGTGDTQAPSVPGNLRSTGKTATSVSLAWDAASDNVGVTGYEVYRGSALATTVAGTSATVTGLTANTAYSLTVKAKDAAGNLSPASAAVSVTTETGGGDIEPPDVSVDNVKLHLQQFQNFATQNGGNRRAGTAGYNASLTYVEQKLRDAGFTVRRQTCTSGCVYQSDNLIADWPGGDETQVVMLGAHLDSVAAGPGSNDNGSGSATILETALTVARERPNLAKHLRFAWWTDEEQGLNGSEFYINQLSTTDRSKIKYYLNFDMVSSPNAGYFINNITTTAAAQLKGYFDSISVQTEENVEGAGRSDDASFKNAGVPTTGFATGASATMSAAQAQKWGGTSGRAFDSCYHQACDKYPENVNATPLNRAADAQAYAIWRLAVEPGSTNQAPSKPGNLRSTGKTQTSVSLAWDASTDDQGVTGYNVYNGGSLATTVTGTSATVSGLTAGTSYTFTVKAKDQPGLESAASDPLSVTTEGGGSGGLANAGFEAGDLSGWTAGGTANVASVVSSGAYEGTKAARLGSTSASNGESTLSQTFTAAAGSSQLSVHYSMTCPDTVTYAWAKVVLKDNTSGQTSTPLAKTCTNGAGWKQVTAALTAGHSYTLTLVNRDDNHPDDPVFTLFDAAKVS